VARAFDRQPQLPGVSIVGADGAIVGVVSRRRFFEEISRPYGVELFFQRPILELWETLIHRDGDECLRLSEQCSIIEALDRALSRPEQFVYEPIVVECEGGRQQLLDMLVLLQAQSQVLGSANGVIREKNRLLESELRDRVAAEAELTRSQHDLEAAKAAAEAANQAKSQFLASMSHELRTPLNAILGLTELMAEDKDFSPEHQENLKIVSRSGEHLLRLINDVLELSKINSGKISLNLGYFNLHDLLDRLRDMLAFKAQSKGLEFVFDRDDNVPEYIEGDEIKLSQVLINLLNNAIKFTLEGRVILRVQSGDREDKKTPSPSIHFEVEDTGMGIAPGEIGQVFEVFVQTETGRNSKEGTGLGLPISQQLVQLMGGEICVSSILGEGTTFSFDIRVNCPDLQQIEASLAEDNGVVPVANDSPIADLKILLAEDNVVNQKVALRMLDRLSYTADVANNGIEVLEALRRHPYDVILMDVQMPQMDGLEATRYILDEWQPHQRPAIVAMTANAMNEDRDRCLAAGMDAHLGKPIRRAALQQTLQKWGKAVRQRRNGCINEQ